MLNHACHQRKEIRLKKNISNQLLTVFYFFGRIRSLSWTLSASVASSRRKGSLAQVVEQRTFNPLVVGSSPARPTKTEWSTLGT